MLAFLQFLSLLYSKNLIYLHFRGVHLARNLDLKACLTVKKRIDNLRLVTLSFHDNSDAVTYLFLLLTQLVDTAL